MQGLRLYHLFLPIGEQKRSLCRVLEVNMDKDPERFNHLIAQV
jgi:hypothetical protein